MKKQDLDLIVDGWQKYKTGMIKIGSKFMLVGYIQVIDARKIAKITGEECIEIDHKKGEYNIEFITHYRDVAFCSVHNSEEL